MNLRTASNSGDLEAPKDSGQLQGTHLSTDTEILGHRNFYVGINAPEKICRSSGPPHGGHHHHRHHRSSRQQKTSLNSQRPVTPPAQRVQFILGEDHDKMSHEPHPLFSEMEELFLGEDGEMEWKETARWVKFEEDVEEGGNRWSKPHVATLTLHSLFELRSILLNGTVCLDMMANNLDDISELVLDNMVNSNVITYDKKELIKETILKRHRHQYEGLKDKNHIANKSRIPLIGSLADIGRNHPTSKSAAAITNHHGSSSSTKFGTESDPNLKENKSDGDVTGTGNESSIGLNKLNSHFMKKLPKDAEASNILIGELDCLDKPVSAFIRLNESAHLGHLTEVPVPTRFIFILLGPAMDNGENICRYHEIGRAVATIMSDEVFHDVAYKAKKREHLLAGIDEFLDAVTVLPPGEWDPSIRIEPPPVVPSQDGRLNPNKKDKHVVDDQEEEERKQREDSGLIRTGRIFGGLINDLKRKKQFYLSDFKDALAVQCVASYIFIYFACLTPIITFGGLLGHATENRIATIESLVSGCVVGVTYGFFSGQPLTIMGSTGPILVFESILYDFCKNTMEWDYLSFRMCIGLWMGIILLILVATDASAFVCYITRFTEENFATLIALIFIKKAVEKLIHISDKEPIHQTECFCNPSNETQLDTYGTAKNFTQIEPTEEYLYGCEFEVEDGVMIQGIEAAGCHFHPNAFLMSVILFMGTFLISNQLKEFKTSPFFPAKVRLMISDFAVIIAIFSMTIADYLIGVDTPKLRVPGSLRPTWKGRDWLIHPLGNNPFWSIFAAILPAILGTILIFMDQQITAVIVNRKEHKLVKGGGYHLDLLIVTLLIILCSIFGLPWFVAATVLSINHVKSLTRESETAAPGEKPQFLGIREQRVTHILIFITIGLSVTMVKFLSLIPMPVLYGVFLYMGAASLNGLQFYDRMLLLLMPKKYQPDLPYLRRVPIKRVHMFTLIQFLCLVCLWVVKDIRETSILFPIMLVVMMGVRKSLDLVFNKNELKILDDILPEFRRHKKLNIEEENIEVECNIKFDKRRRDSLRYTESSIQVSIANGNVIKIPLLEKDETAASSDINISEEMNRSSIWKSLEGSGGNFDTKYATKDEKPKRTKGERRMSVVEEDAEDRGIQFRSPTFSKDQDLPELPLPELADTLDRYLESLKPVTSEEEFAKSEEIITKFKDSDEAMILHAHIEKRTKRTKNWLEEWWLDYAYLYERSSLVFGSNFAGIYSGFEAPEPYQKKTERSRDQVTASYLHEILRFWKDLRQEKIPPTYDSQNNLFSMHQYRYLFNTSRIPGLEKDQMRSWFKTESEGPCPNHVIVMARGRFFKLLPFEGEFPWSAAKIERHLERLNEYVENNRGENLKIGALTALDRTSWAKFRNRLLDENARALSEIESAICVVVLDETRPEDDEELLNEALVGSDVGNRWADKSLATISTLNGLIAGVSEHTQMDGLVAAHLASFAQKEVEKVESVRDKNDYKNIYINLALENDEDDFHEIRFDVGKELIEEIAEATRSVAQIMKIKSDDIETSNLRFREFGKTEIKEVEVHPDTFVQVCLQVAAYWTHSKALPTYETATTRNFHRGRTETVRSCTEEALKLAKAIDIGTRDSKELIALTNSAIRKHTELMENGKHNSGCDRHLMGLQIAAQELNLPQPELFKDPSYIKSGGNGNFVLSTSLGGFNAMYAGCAPMVHDGYGVFYGICDDSIHVTIVTFKSSRESNHDQLEENLQKSFSRIMEILKS